MVLVVFGSEEGTTNDQGRWATTKETFVVHVKLREAKIVRVNERRSIKEERMGEGERTRFTSQHTPSIEHEENRKCEDWRSESRNGRVGVASRV